MQYVFIPGCPSHTGLPTQRCVKSPLVSPRMVKAVHLTIVEQYQFQKLHMMLVQLDCLSRPQTLRKCNPTRPGLHIKRRPSSFFGSCWEEFIWWHHSTGVTPAERYDAWFWVPVWVVGPPPHQSLSGSDYHGLVEVPCLDVNQIVFVIKIHFSENLHTGSTER